MQPVSGYCKILTLPVFPFHFFPRSKSGAGFDKKVEQKIKASLIRPSATFYFREGKRKWSFLWLKIVSSG